MTLKGYTSLEWLNYLSVKSGEYQVVSEVIEEAKSWQNRALDEVYPIVYFDALVVKVRHEKQVVKKHLYLVLAVNLEGDKELLGVWLAESEGAKLLAIYTILLTTLCVSPTCSP